MTSAPVSLDPASFESIGYGSLNFNLQSSCLFPDSSVPIFPINGDAGCAESLGYGPCIDNTATFIHSLSLEERHIFLCFKDPPSWPAVVDAAEFDRLPRFLSASIKARKGEMAKKTRLTICEGYDGTDFANGDLLIFPDMVRYRGLTHFDVDAFIDTVLVTNREWLPGKPERLFGIHIFVCAHARHDVQCGISGPIVIKRFQDEISARGLDAFVFVKPSSHVGGPKYAGNLMVYSSNVAGELSAHWYGYVKPDNVPCVVDELLRKGCLVEQIISCRDVESGHASVLGQLELGSVPGDRGSQWPAIDDNNDIDGGMVEAGETHLRKSLVDWILHGQRVHIVSTSRWSWWLDFWETEDTLAALAVAGAITTVVAAIHLYRMERRL